MSASSFVLVHQTYELRVARAPFGFSLWREGMEVLAAAPEPELGPALAWHTTEAGLVVGFARGALHFTRRTDAIGVRWAPAAEAASRSLALTLRPAGLWYGLGQLIHQRWPLNDLMLAEADFLTADNGATGLSCVLAPALLASTGLGVLVHSAPLRLGLNQPPAAYPRHRWDLGAGQAPFEQRPWADPGGQGDGRLTLSGPALTLELLLGANLPAAQALLRARVGHPASHPPADLFSRPTWTTWARYKTEVDQATVLGFAREIIAQGFPYHVMEIDDRWQVHYGDLAFDPQRFPDPRAMTAELHRLGFKVTAWVIPFLDPEAQAFAEGADRGYLVRTATGEPYQVPWWQGRGGLLDVSHPEARAWFLARLRHLQGEAGLDGFKFDAGEGIFLPADAVTHHPLARNDYAHHYVRFVGEHFSLCEVRSGWHNQTAPIFFRQWDKTTGWGHANGLRSVIPGLLSLGLIGYPFVLPDMIGGNAYGEAPDAELMIRWTQLNALLPAMQFSLAPWVYGEECARLCRAAADLHTALAPRRLAWAAHTARTGEPMIRPVSWLAPADEQALRCDDEFLLGDEWLAAPVVDPGARARDIYLPPGQWRVYETGAVIAGPVTLAGFPAPLSSLPLFERIGNTT